MTYFADFLLKNTVITLFLCLSFGCILGKVRIFSFTIGATAGTLLVGFIVGLFINRFVSEGIGGQNIINNTVKELFFALFFFTIGFEAGPTFFSSLKTSGVKIIALSVFFSAVGLVLIVVMTKAFRQARAEN